MTPASWCLDRAVVLTPVGWCLDRAVVFAKHCSLQRTPLTWGTNRGIREVRSKSVCVCVCVCVFVPVCLCVCVSV